MKNLIFLIPVLLFFSCEKVIDVDLNEANENIVIEARLNAEEKTVEVLISKTTGYFNPEEIQFINDAQVTISNQNGDIQKIELLANGLYKANVNLDLTDSIKIEVAHDLGFYASTSSIVSKSELSLIQTIKAEAPGVSGNQYLLRVGITDDTNFENYYMFETYKGGNKVESFSGGYDIVSDDITNDGLINYLFFGSFHELGDTVNLRLMSINKDAYNYFGDLGQLTSSGAASASPANPINNWSNNALGYFMVFAPNDYTIVIEE
jgi:hypothetical protein